MPIIQSPNGQTKIIMGEGDISTGHMIAADRATGQPNLASSYMCIMVGNNLKSGLPPDGSRVVTEWPVEPTIFIEFKNEEVLEGFVRSVNSMLLDYQRAVIDSIQDAVVVPASEAA